MDDNAIHEWLIKCFGPIQGEMAWQQISQLPEEIREQLMSQDPSRLPNPSEVQQVRRTCGWIPPASSIPRPAIRMC